MFLHSSFQRWFKWCIVILTLFGPVGPCYAFIKKRTGLPIQQEWGPDESIGSLGELAAPISPHLLSCLKFPSPNILMLFASTPIHKRGVATVLGIQASTLHSWLQELLLTEEPGKVCNSWILKKLWIRVRISHLLLSQDWRFPVDLTPMNLKGWRMTSHRQILLPVEFCSGKR